MIIHTVKQIIPNIKARQIYDFMINPNDKSYSEWWQGEHLRFNIVKRGNSKHLHDVVYFDEYLGKRHRLTFYALVVKADRPNLIVWQMIKSGVKLPAVVALQLRDSSRGLMLKHELRLGFKGIGKIFEPLIKFYFNDSFQNALQEHCNEEWFRLRELLNSKSVS